MVPVGEGAGVLASRGGRRGPSRATRASGSPARDRTDRRPARSRRPRSRARSSTRSGASTGRRGTRRRRTSSSRARRVPSPRRRSTGSSREAWRTDRCRTRGCRARGRSRLRAAPGRIEVARVGGERTTLVLVVAEQEHPGEVRPVDQVGGVVVLAVRGRTRAVRVVLARDVARGRDDEPRRRRASGLGAVTRRPASGSEAWAWITVAAIAITPSRARVLRMTPCYRRPVPGRDRGLRSGRAAIGSGTSPGGRPGVARTRTEGRTPRRPSRPSVRRTSRDEPTPRRSASRRP